MNRRTFFAALFAAPASATVTSIPQFSDGATVTAKPVVVTKPEILSAEAVVVRDAAGQPMLDSWGGQKRWIEIVRLIPSNEIDLVTGLPKPDLVIRETWTGPYDQGVYARPEQRGVRHPETTVPGMIEWE